MVIGRIFKSFLPGGRRDEYKGEALGSPVPEAKGGIVGLAQKVEESLSTVIVPGYDIDLVSSGIVKRIRVSRDGKKVAVFLDYSGSDPGCYYCKFINWSLWKRLLTDAESKLKSQGFDEVLFIDWFTGAVIEFRKD